MFNRKEGKGKTATISVKVLSERDVKSAIERIEEAFPADEADDALAAVVCRCVCLGACAVADELAHGERGEDGYAEMRADAERIAELTVVAHALGLEGKGSAGALEAILKEVLG